MSFVTPYMTPQAEALAKLWMQSRKMPVFIMAHEQPGELAIPVCKNCSGVGTIFLRFADGGPYQNVTTRSKVVTWYEGDGQYGKGWYTLDRTEVIECPECKGREQACN